MWVYSVSQRVKQALTEVNTVNSEGFKGGPEVNWAL